VSSQAGDGFLKSGRSATSFSKPEGKGTMTKIQIICSSPGMRRNGIEHAASEFYEPGHWTETQLDAFRADPAFTVREADEAVENTLSADDFNLKVDAEVARQVGLKTAALEKSFKKAVEEAVDDKVAKLKGEQETALDAIGKKLASAEASVAELQTKLDAAEKASAKK
jgi:predicted HicB family RNase H-like nuclease